MAKKGKKKVRKKKVRFKREPSKLPANRVVSANQYLHLQRQIDEMKMMPTRANRYADYRASQGNPYMTATVAQREIIDTLRMTPDIRQGLEKKEYEDRIRKLIESNERLEARLTPATPSLRRVATPSRQADRSQTEYEASTHAADSGHWISGINISPVERETPARTPRGASCVSRPCTSTPRFGDTPAPDFSDFVRDERRTQFLAGGESPVMMGSRGKRTQQKRRSGVKP